MRLEDIESGQQLNGVIPGEAVRVIAAQRHGQDAVELTFQTNSGKLAQCILYRADEGKVVQLSASGRPFDAQAADFKLAAEAQRIRLAGLFDPMVAVSTSDVEPLPHQISAVYGELLARTPLRFLLADDPGAGKTIMAGLYIKELILRDDVQRCLVVAPGGLVEQWQDELFLKFGLHFQILTNSLIEANINVNIFETHPFLIARMDQLSRNDDLRALLGDSEWDLIIVDEAHRMAARYFGGERRKTRRFELGELLRGITRHFLLMTATPHSGIEQDFQLFLTLLDEDRFEGRAEPRNQVDTSDVMRRMVKEKLLTFEGKPLFPKRIAETVPYRLTQPEQDLYEQVTDYVRQGFDRAERLNDKRRNTVGFALTVLQRRLASSPEAILRSLERRTQRLEHRKSEISSGPHLEVDVNIDFGDYNEDDYSAEEMERAADELVDAATAAQTLEELDIELAELDDLTRLARQVRNSGEDRKWAELRSILQDHALRFDENGRPRKLIVFTEHRDTLDYLERRIGTLFGRADAVQAIHGAVRRTDRRRITEEFTKNPECQILLATDAAGEGLNLQAAHLMVNYDLPWNPNRIEQRFGRIHRIGQAEVCRLWNLVADNTREGEVFTRLLDKIEQQRRAYGGEVFDVLGEAFEGTPLRNLLVDAIRYGERPEVRARMHEVIDAQVGEGLDDLMNERALSTEVLSQTQLRELRAAMDEARAHKLQPHYIQLAFCNAFRRLGGQMARRERGRSEISHVPKRVRDASKLPIASRYERVTFDLEYIHGSDGATADLLAPGHPLHDAVMAETASSLRPALEAGTVLVSAAVSEPHLLVGVTESIVDGTSQRPIASRFSYAFVDQHGTVSDAGPAPYLDCEAAPEGRGKDAARRLPWLAQAETRAVTWLVENRLPQFIEEVTPRRAAQLTKQREQVEQRLSAERERLYTEAVVASAKEAAGERPKVSADSLTRKAQDLDARLQRRLGIIAQQEQMSPLPPRISACAVVLPARDVMDELPADSPLRHAKDTAEVDRRGVAAVMAHERRLGRHPVEMAHNHKGYDIESHLPDGGMIPIEVKSRVAGARDFSISHNQVLLGKNSAPRYRLALVRVDQRDPDHDEVRYLDDPFSTTELGHFDTIGLLGDWDKTWNRGREPF
ncbi:MAG: helicase-related protein [Brooklawnia sp.]|jgi:superfamily II DNA or RNA helicase